jgi:hypothetical protein
MMAARTGARAARRGRDLPLVDLRRQLVADTSHSLLGVVWRWRNEAAGAFLALCLFGHLEQRVGRAPAWWTLAAVLVVVMALPWSRRLVIGWFWCAVTRHRLFAVFDESRVFNRSGRFPLILRVARTPVGERAVVWCRPGICAEDLEARVEDIRAACWARDARVARSARWSQLVAVEIVRRDPLAVSETVGSALARRPNQTEAVNHAQAA